jgi:hypothetical protein
VGHPRRAACGKTLRKRIAEMMPNRTSDPSPVPLRLVKAPERDTLSPGERAIRSLRTPGVQPKIRVTISPLGEGREPHPHPLPLGEGQQPNPHPLPSGKGEDPIPSFFRIPLKQTAFYFLLSTYCFLPSYAPLEDAPSGH